MNNLIFLRQNLYALKRQYGYAGALYRMTTGPTNLETGEKTVTKVKYSIDNCIVLPFKLGSIGFYSSAMLKAAREFSYGGFQDQDLKHVLLDGNDLPDNFEILPDDYFVYEHKKFEIVKIEKLEQDLGYQLLVNWLRGSIPNEIHEVTIYQTLRIRQVTGGLL
jgi:hypothetical protein